VLVGNCTSVLLGLSKSAHAFFFCFGRAGRTAAPASSAGAGLCAAAGTPLRPDGTLAPRGRQPSAFGRLPSNKSFKPNNNRYAIIVGLILVLGPMRQLALAILLFLSLPAIAAIEKTATTTESGIRLMWWPKVAPPPGWHFDQGSSQYFSFRAIAPDGSTFSKAETVMYARADYKPRIPETKSLDSYIANDTAGFKSASPGLVVSQEHSIHGKGHMEFRVVSYSPREASEGNWERVAYGEDGDYYLTFVISSRTKSGLMHSQLAFNTFVAGYEPGP
jgi:hypothetical protein